MLLDSIIGQVHIQVLIIEVVLLRRGPDVSLSSLSQQ